MDLNEKITEIKANIQEYLDARLDTIWGKQLEKSIMPNEVIAHLRAIIADGLFAREFKDISGGLNANQAASIFPHVKEFSSSAEEAIKELTKLWPQIEIRQWASEMVIVASRGYLDWLIPAKRIPEKVDAFMATVAPFNLNAPLVEFIATDIGSDPRQPETSEKLNLLTKAKLVAVEAKNHTARSDIFRNSLNLTADFLSDSTTGASVYKLNKTNEHYSLHEKAFAVWKTLHPEVDYKLSEDKGYSDLLIEFRTSVEFQAKFETAILKVFCASALAGRRDDNIPVRRALE